MTHLLPHSRKISGFACLCSLALVFLTSCGQQGQERPTPPDMTGVIESFANPDGRLTGETGHALIEDLAGYASDLDAFLAFQQSIVQVFDSLSNTDESKSRLTEREQASEFGTLSNGLSYSAGAWSVITYTCGPDSDINADRHGYGRLTAFMTSSGFQGVFWGDFVNCVQYEGETKSVTLDGRISIHSPDFEEGNLLVSITGSIDAGSGNVMLDDDFHFEGSTVRTIRRVREQDFVIGLNPGNSLEISVRDCSGDWNCILEDRTCGFTTATGACAPDTQTVSW